MIGDRAVPIRGRDQVPEPEEQGQLICRVAQTGADSWHGTTPDGRRLSIRRIGDGSLEIRHLAEPAGDEADPDVVGTTPGMGGDPARPARAGTDDALARYRQTGRPEFHMGGLAEYQRRLNEHYRFREQYAREAGITKLVIVAVAGPASQRSDLPPPFDPFGCTRYGHAARQRAVAGLVERGKELGSSPPPICRP